MRPFSFTLHAVKTVREQEETAAQLRYAGALQAKETAAVRLALARRDLEGVWELLRSRTRSGVTVEQLEQVRGYGVLIQDRVRALERALLTAQQALEQTREDMSRATRNREALDKVQRRQRAHYDYAVARLEHKFLDDLAARPATLGAVWRPASEI